MVGREREGKGGKGRIPFSPPVGPCPSGIRYLRTGDCIRVDEANGLFMSVAILHVGDCRVFFMFLGPGGVGDMFA